MHEVNAFGTPTVVHFCAVLLGSASLSAPWHRLSNAALILALFAIAGMALLLLYVGNSQRMGHGHLHRGRDTKGVQMTSASTRRFVGLAVMAFAVGSASTLRAQLGVGTWVRQADASMPAGMTMTVQPCCNGGFRLTYHAGPVVLTVDSPFDGTEVPVLIGGKPSGETMAIKRVDAHHTSTVLKMNGQPFGTSRSTLSADGKTLTVENNITFAAGGRTSGHQTETWVRK